MKKHFVIIAFCLFARTISGEEPDVPPIDPSKDNVAATDAALKALGAEMPKFRNGYEGFIVDVLVDAHHVSDARIVALVQAFKKNGASGVNIFESPDQNAERAALCMAQGAVIHRRLQD